MNRWRKKKKKNLLTEQPLPPPAADWLIVSLTCGSQSASSLLSLLLLFRPRLLQLLFFSSSSILNSSGKGNVCLFHDLLVWPKSRTSTGGRIKQPDLFCPNRKLDSGLTFDVSTVSKHDKTRRQLPHEKELNKCETQ